MIFRKILTSLTFPKLYATCCLNLGSPNPPKRLLKLGSNLKLGLTWDQGGGDWSWLVWKKLFTEKKYWALFINFGNQCGKFWVVLQLEKMMLSEIQMPSAKNWAESFLRWGNIWTIFYNQFLSNQFLNTIIVYYPLFLQWKKDIIHLCIMHMCFTLAINMH